MEDEFGSLELALTITKAEWLTLAKLTIRKKFDPASASIFDEATLSNSKKKLWEALINEILIDAVKAVVAEGEGNEQQGDTAAPPGEAQES